MVLLSTFAPRMLVFEEIITVWKVLFTTKAWLVAGTNQRPDSVSGSIAMVYRTSDEKDLWVKKKTFSDVQ